MIAREDTITSINLAMTTTRDSSSMKVIAIMTMIFLPGTFLAALFAVPSLDWKADTVVQDNFWVYWAFTIPFTIFVLVSWGLLTNQFDWRSSLKALNLFTA
jgi:Mg2+ and Co2+ transporter CorA